MVKNSFSKGKHLTIVTFLVYNIGKRSAEWRKPNLPKTESGKQMELHVLAVGDIVGTPGLQYLRKQLPKLRKEKKIDFCVVNGENAAMVGITPSQAEEIFDAGADCITLGNHTWNQRDIVPYLEDHSRILRPANFAPQMPGDGFGIYETDRGPVAVINLIGRCDLDFHADNPFTKMDALLKKT